MDLYALPPGEFTAARDAAVKQARADGDRPRAKELAALRRPTASAHLVNLLVRADPDLVTQLLDLGRQLAEAQEAGRGGDLRALAGQRRALVQAVTDRAVEGSDAPTAVRTEVEATLDAALADPGAGEAVRSGRLVRALAYAGFGGTDLSGAVALEPAATVDVSAAERAAQEAAGRLDDAVRALEQAHRVEDDAVDRVTAAVDAETEAEQALADARQARRAAEQESLERQEATEVAAEAVRLAQDAAEQARSALDRLRRG